MSESVGSNAEDNVSSASAGRKRARQEEEDSAESRSMEEEQGRPFKTRRLDSEEFSESEIRAILSAAAEHVQKFPRDDHTQTIARFESVAIAEGLHMCPTKVEQILNDFYWKFCTFCSQMASPQDIIAKNYMKFCSNDGNIFPANPLYRKTRDALVKQHSDILTHYILLRKIFHFTWDVHFGSHTSFKRHQDSIPATSGCDSCELIEDFGAKQCQFFNWYDEDMCPRAKELIWSFMKKADGLKKKVVDLNSNVAQLKTKVTEFKEAKKAQQEMKKKNMLWGFLAISWIIIFILVALVFNLRVVV